jgi:hypothetical protein
MMRITWLFSFFMPPCSGFSLHNSIISIEKWLFKAISLLRNSKRQQGLFPQPAGS